MYCDSQAVRASPPSVSERRTSPGVCPVGPTERGGVSRRVAVWLLSSCPCPPRRRATPRLPIHQGDGRFTDRVLVAGPTVGVELNRHRFTGPNHGLHLFHVHRFGSPILLCACRHPVHPAPALGVRGRSCQEHALSERADLADDAVIQDDTAHTRMAPRCRLGFVASSHSLCNPFRRWGFPRAVNRTNGFARVLPHSAWRNDR